MINCIVVIYCLYIESDASGTFTVNSSTGYIILSAPLDRENTSSYNFRVMVSDMLLY